MKTFLLLASLLFSANLASPAAHAQAADAATLPQAVDALNKTLVAGTYREGTTAAAGVATSRRSGYSAEYGQDDSLVFVWNEETIAKDARGRTLLYKRFKQTWSVPVPDLATSTVSVATQPVQRPAGSVRRFRLATVSATAVAGTTHTQTTNQEGTPTENRTNTQGGAAEFDLPDTDLPATLAAQVKTIIQLAHDEAAPTKN